MPSVSQAQQKLMALAEHNPSAVSEKNAGVLKMSHDQLHGYAATPEKGLPEHVKHAQGSLGGRDHAAHQRATAGTY